MRVARITAFVVGAVAIAIAIVLGPTFNVAFLVALAFAVAASANLPVIVLLDLLEALHHRRRGWGLGDGLVSSLGLDRHQPQHHGRWIGQLWPRRRAT